jgi:hypothetical protein
MVSNSSGFGCAIAGLARQNAATSINWNAIPQTSLKLIDRLPSPYAATAALSPATDLVNVSRARLAPSAKHRADHDWTSSLLSVFRLGKLSLFFPQTPVSRVTLVASYPRGKQHDKLANLGKKVSDRVSVAEAAKGLRWSEWSLNSGEFSYKCNPGVLLNSGEFSDGI